MRRYQSWDCIEAVFTVDVCASFSIELLAANDLTKWLWMCNDQKAIVWAQDAMLKYIHLTMVGKAEGVGMLQNEKGRIYT